MLAPVESKLHQPREVKRPGG